MSVTPVTSNVITPIYLHLFGVPAGIPSQTTVKGALKRTPHPRQADHYSSQLQSTPSPSQRVAEVRVLQVRRINLTELSPKTLLLLLADATFSSLPIPTAILPHVVQSPTDDQDELNAK